MAAGDRVSPSSPCKSCLLLLLIAARGRVGSRFPVVVLEKIGMGKTGIGTLSPEWEHKVFFLFGRARARASLCEDSREGAPKDRGTDDAVLQGTADKALGVHAEMGRRIRTSAPKEARTAFLRWDDAFSDGIARYIPASRVDSLSESISSFVISLRRFIKGEKRMIDPVNGRPEGAFSGGVSRESGVACGFRTGRRIFLSSSGWRASPFLGSWDLCEGCDNPHTAGGV